MKLMNSWRSASDQISAAYRTKTGVSATVRMPYDTALPYYAQAYAETGIRDAQLVVGRKKACNHGRELANTDDVQVGKYRPPLTFLPGLAA
jgi:hypothetical protein